MGHAPPRSSGRPHLPPRKTIEISVADERRIVARMHQHIMGLQPPTRLEALRHEYVTGRIELPEFERRAEDMIRREIDADQVFIERIA